MTRTAARGAVLGLTAGLVALAVVFVVALGCLSFRISSPPQPWPWYCSDPAYSLIGYLAFPVNRLTNDLSQAVLLAPLALLTYAVLGALIAAGLHGSRS
jgi:hypothetical protein